MADMLVKDKKTVEIDKSLVYNSTYDRENGKIIFTNEVDGSEITMDIFTCHCSASIGDSALAHRNVYLSNSKFNHIIHNTSSEVVAVSKLHKPMKPLLDDFAQICGTKVKSATVDNCGKKIKGKNAVLLKDQGALCCGAVEGDAQAVDMIMSKSALALLGSKVFGKAKTINPVESALMRVVYLAKYSKKANQ